MSRLKNTRERIIVVARGVFANLSLTKTTMDDIARESKMGRRTIYSYFDSKEELYKEVVNLQIKSILRKLEAVTSSEKMSEEKIKIFIRRRMKAVKDICLRNPSVRNDFFNHPEQIEILRKNLDTGEIDLLNDILVEGFNRGEFQHEDAKLTAFILQKSIKSLELPMLNDGFGEWSRNITEKFIDTLLCGIKKKTHVS